MPAPQSSLQLRSLISSNSDGFDLYRARIRLENGSAQETLRVRLPSPAVLQEAMVAGEAIVPNAQGEELLIPGLNAARRDVKMCLQNRALIARHHANQVGQRVFGAKQVADHFGDGDQFTRIDLGFIFLRTA